MIGDFISMILKFTGFTKISQGMSFFSLIFPEYLWVLPICICTSVYQWGNFFFCFIFLYCLGSYCSSFSSEHLQYFGPLNPIDFVLLPFLKFSSTLLIELSFTFCQLLLPVQIAVLKYFYMSSLAYFSHPFVNFSFPQFDLSFSFLFLFHRYSPLLLQTSMKSKFFTICLKNKTFFRH